MTLDETLKKKKHSATEALQAATELGQPTQPWHDILRLIDALKTCRLQRNLLSKEFGHIETMDAELLAILRGGK